MDGVVSEKSELAESRRPGTAPSNSDSAGYTKEEWANQRPNFGCCFGDLPVNNPQASRYLSQRRDLTLIFGWSLILICGANTVTGRHTIFLAAECARPAYRCLPLYSRPCLSVCDVHHVHVISALLEHGG